MSIPTTLTPAALSSRHVNCPSSPNPMTAQLSPSLRSALPHPLHGDRPQGVVLDIRIRMKLHAQVLRHAHNLSMIGVTNPCARYHVSNLKSLTLYPIPMTSPQAEHPSGEYASNFFITTR